LPTVLREGRYRLFFYASDRGEPPHVHVEHEQKVAKFWLDPVRLARTGDFSRAEILEIERMVAKNRERIVKAWNEFFGS
jgi:hypothetical protein